MLAPGDVLRGYRILSRLKAGGMATLWLAEREGAAGFVRRVAIKTVHPHLAEDAEFVRMFVDEARLAARIDDPNVVRTEELGEDEGRLFLVMELVEGCSLSELWRALRRAREPVPLALAVWIAMQVASGLHAAHEATLDDGAPLDIVHRDVSPQNVLLAFRGHVKVIDFGIAKPRGRARTKDGGIKGKLAYMSPEQAHGAPLDRRSDVYALGVVLWELLTMRRLFDAENDMALLTVVRDPRVPAPSTIRPDVPAALDAAVLRALAPDVADRPPTARAFRDLLAKAMPSVLEVAPEDLARLLSRVMAKEIADSRLRRAEPSIIGPSEQLVTAPGPGSGSVPSMSAITPAPPVASIAYAMMPSPPWYRHPPASPEVRAREAAARQPRMGIAISLALLGALLGMTLGLALASHARRNAEAEPAPSVVQP